MSKKLLLLVNPCRIKMQIRTGVISILLFASFQMFGIPLRSQNIYKAQINLELKNESLAKAFKKIEAGSSFYFMYRDEDVKNINNLNIPDSKQSIADFLTLILANTSLSFKQVDQRILINHKNSQDSTNQPEKTNFSQQSLDMVEDTVSGLVTNDNGDPLEGVTVTLKGSSIVTLTNAEGKYKISIPPGGVLIFSYVGFETQEVAVSNQTIINAVLRQQISTLNPVVVTALGIRRQARSLTYSTQGVRTKELTEARTLNVVNALQGKVAGLTIESAGTGLGSASRVLLRGNRSIDGNNGPLYVVDGVPMNTAISRFSPDIIESIDVLKGPNAAALYGSAAQNGVIIIETKKGKAGGTQISVNETFQVGRPIHYFQPQNEFGQGVTGVYNPTSEENWGPKMTGQMVDHWSGDPNKVGTQYAFLPQPDNYKDIFQTSRYMSHNVNVSVGSQNTQAAFSYTREDARGLMVNNELRRNNVSVRVTSQLKKWLSLDTKLNYIRDELDNQHGTGDDAATNPYMNIYRLPRNIIIDDLRQFEYTDLAGNNKQNFWNPGSTIGRNPFWITNRVLNYQTTDRVMALASLTLNFTDKLKLIGRTSFDGGSSAIESKTWIDSYGGAANFGFYSASMSGPHQTWNHDVLLTYNDNITKDLSVSALAGGTLRKLDGSGSIFATTSQGLIIPNFFSFGNASTTVGSFSPETRSETQSLYFSGNFGWKNVLYLDVTGRNDWSSTLPADSRSYFYPSVGLSAIISDMIPGLPDVLSYAKLRASYAKVGSSPSPYQLSRSASFDGTGGNFGFIRLGGTLPNANLKPETTKGYEIGLDLRFFDGRLGLDLSAYKTNTFDQLFEIVLPSGSGAASLFTNGGDVENKGIEAVLSATPVQNSNGFTWDISSNFSTNKNWVNKISDDRPSIVIGGDVYMSDFVVAQGQEFGNIYTSGWERDAKGGVIVDGNGMPTFTAGRTVLAANFNPDWMGAITNNFSYKNFSFGFLIEHRQGGNMVSITDALLAGEGTTKETLAGRDGGLIFGQNLFGNEVAVKADGTPNTTPISSQTFWRTVGGRNSPIGEAFIVSATNTRVREATLGFVLPKSLLTKLPFISNVKLSLVGRNLFFIHKTGNWDPEILAGSGTASAGFQTYVPPTERTIGLNLKVDF